MNNTPVPTPPTKFADWQRERMADAPTTLPELITILADRQPHLARLQDELERATEHVQEFERRDVELNSLVGAAAIATGERKPHPAVTVQHKCKARVGYIPVKIKEDLSPYRSDGNKRAWCYGCLIGAPDKCGGTVGINCARYPLILEYDDKNYDPVTDEL